MINMKEFSLGGGELIIALKLAIKLLIIVSNLMRGCTPAVRINSAKSAIAMLSSFDKLFPANTTQAWIQFQE